MRLDKRVTSISLLLVIGARRDGQKILLAVKNMGGETEAAWRAVLDDLFTRGLRTPDLVIVDGGKGLEAALASLIPELPVQRRTVQKERNLLAHAPKRLHDEISAGQAQGLPGQMAAQVPRGRGEPGGSGGTAHFSGQPLGYLSPDSPDELAI